MRIGVVGCGRWGKNIVRTLLELKPRYGLEVDVITTGSATTAKLAAEQFGLKCRTDVSSYLDSTPAALVIASPDDSHAAIAKESLRRGIATFVEKPLALALSETEDLIRLAREKNTLLTAGHILVFHPCIAHIESWLAKSGQTPKAFYSSRLAQFALTQGKSVLKSSLIHDISMVDGFVRKTPSSVQVGEFFHSGARAEYLDLLLDYPGGVKAHLMGSSIWPENSRTFVLWTEDCYVHFDGVQNRVKIYRQKDGVYTLESEASPAGQPLTAELENFLASVSEPSRIRVTPDHILRVMQTIDLIERQTAPKR